MYGHEMQCGSVSLTFGFHIMATCHATQLLSHGVVSSCGQKVTVMWVSYKRLRLVYLSLCERYDRPTHDVPLNFVGPPLLSGKYLTVLIIITTPTNRHYVKHLWAKGTKMFGMFTSLSQDLKRHNATETLVSYSSTSTNVFVQDSKKTKKTKTNVLLQTVYSDAKLQLNFSTKQQR